MGAPNTSYGQGTWFHTGGLTAGYYPLTMPIEPGQYEFRYLLDNGFETVAARSKPVQVVAAPSQIGQSGSTCWALHLVNYVGGVDQGTLRLYRDGRATFNGTTGIWKEEANGQQIWLDMSNHNFADNYHYKFKRDGNKLTLLPGNYFHSDRGSEATPISCPAGQ